jgi:predicted Zn-dependent protease
MGTGGLIMITKTAERLVEIEQEIKALTTAAITGEISHVTARYEIQKLSNEREGLWAAEREHLWAQ